MVHGKAQGGKRAISPVRTSTRIRSARYQPTARDGPAVIKPHRNLNQTWPSTIYKLNIPGQIQSTPDHSRPCPPHLLQSLKNFDDRDGARNNVSSLMRHNMSSLRTPRHEKSILDKVEDMDVDNQSDQELCLTEENAVRMSKDGTSQSNNSESMKEKSIKVIKGNTNCVHVVADKDVKLKKNGINEPSLSANKTKKSETIVKKKPVYIILHASRLKVGHLQGRAVQAVRIQAGKMLVEMELQSNDKQEASNESLTLRVPCKELHSVKVNLTEPPFLFVAVINDTYTKVLVESGRNKILSKLKGNNNLQVIIHLMYDVIPNYVSQGLLRFRSELGNDVRWEELSSTKAEHILNGDDSSKVPGDDKEKTEVDASLRKEDTKSRKRQMNCESVSNRNHTKEEYNMKTPEKNNCNKTSVENEELQIVEKPPSPAVRHRRKRTFDETQPNSGKHKIEKKINATVPEEKSVDDKKDTSVATSEVVHTDEVNKSGVPTGLSASSSNERSFEEDRLETRRIRELQSNIAEKESMLTQQRRTVELRDLQLEQERNSVRGLRASLREEQRTKRDLEARYEAVNSELLVRNTREINADARLRELEQELSHLNISLNSSRNENERLAQEIHQVRGRLTENEESLQSEREVMASLQQEIETTRSTLETLREDLREKDVELAEQRALIATTAERNTQLQQQLVTTRNEYELRIARSNDEHQRTQREHEECSRQLASTRDQLQDVNRALHRAQETVDEYSRMQPRDWTIARDEIVITEKVLGHGAWGWVKEGRFRGTLVAVKQMHELIVSPHNRRLFEREMQIAARCRHPNLLQFIGATGDNGLALLVTELLDTDLRTVLGQRSLCHDEVVTIATDVSRALNYLHLNKPFPIIHRDISSTNVLLWKREDIYHAKLSDYGAANFMRQCMTASPGACIYAAPEAATSRQSTKVDVYSFGLLLCEVCIRELPVPGHTHEQIRSITNGHLRELVQRSTHRTPENRPTMSEVITALLRLSPNNSLGTISRNNRHVV